MEMDVNAAVRFVATHGRVLDRRRLDVLLGRGEPEPVLAALDAYRNGDGGYGWGLEPDQRSATSQPVGAMHALEVLADAGDGRSPRPIEVCDWLAAHSRADGGIPFGLPHDDTAGNAKHWVDADPAVSSLQMTAQLAAQAHRIARRRADVAGHPWLAAATAYCIDQIERLGADPHAYVVMFALHFADTAPPAHHLVERLLRYVVPDGPTPVRGGAGGEALHLLDFAPYADGPGRRALPAGALAKDRERLAAAQRDDGGWTVDYPVYSPAAALEWRAYATVQAVRVLRGR
ncbi:hypothetical protein Dvina_30335 [Dactylosporangium vinaceum]|uniref:Prenyltransferase n=1 Tax=Dactylosporangium vinaceum TaxID=53362 RepID=A0ABV5MJK0_9ACTN|nr:hypothetical protein [Dactylosporangium vinaceum]UAB92628.1 hypothetical protein Dvina_30335 [Dactylosporangium vinaceum]